MCFVKWAIVSALNIFLCWVFLHRGITTLTSLKYLSTSSIASQPAGHLLYQLAASDLNQQTLLQQETLLQHGHVTSMVAKLALPLVS